MLAHVEGLRDVVNRLEAKLAMEVQTHQRTRERLEALARTIYALRN